MNTDINTLYKSRKMAEMFGEKPKDLIDVPPKYQADAEKALDGNDSVKVPKKSGLPHMDNLANFAANQRSKKKNKNRTASKSRRRNRR